MMSFSCSLDSGALKAYGHRKPVQSRQSMETSVATTEGMMEQKCSFVQGILSEEFGFEMRSREAN
ncbi:hypothetical protein L195_g015235 [Trifolium pratense]|uniref:Uncharacterized protein n=1 Tax=Trifolium pratense TaxID=57577 RepID=A0A2K3MMR4_TRIPR|nr:hypothetical protein L195_g015235 [Trifolium pratense]